MEIKSNSISLNFELVHRYNTNFNLHYTKLYKICLLSHCLLCLEKFDSYVEKVRFFQQFSKNLLAHTLCFSIFYYCFKRQQTQTRFFITEKSERGDDLLNINTSRIILARCQLSDLESL